MYLSGFASKPPQILKNLNYSWAPSQYLTEIFPKVWFSEKYKKQTHRKRDVKILH